MKLTDFGKEMDRLKEAYPHKPHAYPNGRVLLIYEWAQRINPAHFTAIISKLIEENENPPMLPKFKEAYSSILRDSFTTDHSHKGCDRCDGRGIILGRWRADPRDFSKYEDFACNVCLLGKARKDLKYWNDSFAEKYIPRWESTGVTEIMGTGLKMVSQS